jgi:hypothetical protein
MDVTAVTTGIPQFFSYVEPSLLNVVSALEREIMQRQVTSPAYDALSSLEGWEDSPLYRELAGGGADVSGLCNAAEACRQRAEELRALAKHKTPRVARKLLTMAESWAEMARKAELLTRKVHRPQGARALAAQSSELSSLYGPPALSFRPSGRSRKCAVR